jgi:quinol monooxygenase YgiN
MAEPVFFASHFRIKEGGRDAVTEAARDTASHLQANKPRTVLFLIYLDREAETISFLHAFPDADALDVHSVGADER